MLDGTPKILTPCIIFVIVQQQPGLLKPHYRRALNPFEPDPGHKSGAAILIKEVTMLKSGTCPKCESGEVYSGATIPLKKGPFGSNSIPISLTSIAALDNYVCTSCGYIERYISDTEKLTEITEKWSKVNAGESATAEATK